MERSFIVDSEKWDEFLKILAERKLADDEFDNGFDAGLILADVVIKEQEELVHCKNCEFSVLDGNICIGHGTMPAHKTNPDKFCSDGAYFYGKENGIN